ncbi:MAG: FG-GAP-like repeat-containing protein [Smithellaceae bacterium]
MRKYLQLIFCLTIILLATGSPWAKDKYMVTVLPFSLHSAENIDYLKQGIEDMLSTRIFVTNKIEVTGKNIVSEELKKIKSRELTSADVYNLGKKLKSDYVVWGSITKIGKSISIDGKLADITANKSDIGIFAQSQSLDEVIPKINDFSQRIVQHILGITSPATTQDTGSATSAPTASANAPPSPPGSSRESQIIAGMKTGKRGTLTSAINAEYINTPDPTNRRGFWMSEKVPTEFKGMDIGDVNNDGLNEVVAIDSHNIYIYQKTGNELKLLEKIAGNSYDNYIAVDVADINRDGVKQIFVTSLNDTTLDSFVLEFKDGKYVKIASDIRWFLRVIDTPSGLLLLGQDYGFNKPLDTQIYEIVWRDGKYVSDQKMKIPLGLSIYGLTIDNVGTGGGEKIIALDELDYLCIFEKTNKPLSKIFTFGFSSDALIWRSDEVYGGSNNYFENIDKTHPENNSETIDKSAFANLRILTFDTKKDGKKQIIIAKNLSSVGRVFKHLKLFTSSEIYNLEWDGMGMAENWRTKKINGYIADYCFKNIDNDGKPKLVLALVSSVGASLQDRSVIVVYELNTAQ